MDGVKGVPTSLSTFAYPASSRLSPHQICMPSSDKCDIFRRQNGSNVPMRSNSPRFVRRNCRNLTLPEIFRNPGTAYARRSAPGPDVQWCIYVSKSLPSDEKYSARALQMLSSERAHRPELQQDPAAVLLIQTPQPRQSGSPDRRQGLHQACWAAAQVGTPCTPSS